MNPAHYHLYTDCELHRIARDSTDPLVLELMRRLDNTSDALRKACDHSTQDCDIHVLEKEIEELNAQIKDLEQQLESVTTLTPNN